MKRFCVNSLNFSKNLVVWFAIPCIFVIFTAHYISETVAYYAVFVLTVYLFLALPIYWVLLIIQKIMICIWDNEGDYFNLTEEM